MSKEIDEDQPIRTRNWLKRMIEQPTLTRKGAWLLKYESSDTRIWVNELNKKIQAKRERLYRGNWVLESRLINKEWVNADE